MSIPDFQSLMLPLMHVITDGKEYSISEIIEKLGKQFQLTEVELRELLPSGRQAKFANRVGWAKHYLNKACLLEAPRRTMVKITERGLQVVSSKPTEINIRFLMQFSEFVEFRRRGHRVETVEPEEEIKGPMPTPLETLEESYSSIRQSLAQEIIEMVMKCPPAFFEKLVVDLLIAMGYGGSRKDAGAAIGRSGDGGVDGIIKEDKLGLDVVYIQAKRWNGSVSVSEVQAFAGSLEGFRARKGVMITTSKFTPKAHEYIDRIEKKIVLIDGDQLAQFMIDYNIGVSEVSHYVVKRMDLDYFESEI